MIEQTVSHYKILEKLGEGGMGVVYKARDTKLDRIVALKFLPAHVSVNEEMKARFLQEAKAAASLNHANICTIHGVEVDGDKMFIDMEYIEGGTLSNKLPYSRVDDALNAAIQIGEALHEAHSKGIVHRDIKAENIMLTSKGQVKVMDFGLAKLKGSLKLTRTSSTVGTLGYMAPEQIQGGEVDTRSDIFSYGVLLFEMLTGQLPFRGEHEAAMVYSIVNEEPSPLTKFKPDLSPELDRIIGRALEKDPEDRYQSVADMVSELRREKKKTARVVRPTIAGAANPPLNEKPVPAHKVGSRKKLMQWGTLGVAGAAVIAGLLLVHPWTDNSSGRKTIAVLPFENQSDPAKEYFADGITEEITTRLSGLSGLGVIARSSARTYKGSKKSIRDIGNELGVQYVLMGTVRWSGQQVRVIPELISVNSGLQVWSEALDASPTDAFSLQSNIATKVAGALDVRLLKPEAASLKEKLTSSAQAYDYYLQGIEYSNRSTARSDHEIAATLFQRAIQADPSFAAAYAKLSIVYSNMYWFFYDRTQTRLDKAREAADKALSLSSNLTAAHEAMGWYYYHGLLDYVNSLKEFSVALDLQPGNADVYYGMASVYRRQGRMLESIDAFEKAVQGNPRVADLVRQLGETLTLARQYARADEVYDRSLGLAPDIQTVYAEKAKNLLLWKGDIPAAVDLLKRGRQYGSVVEDIGLDLDEYGISLMTGDFAQAEHVVNSIPGNVIGNQFVYYPQSLLLAQIWSLRGSPAKARTFFDKARVQLERELKVKPDDERMHSSLGIAYAGLNRTQDALREGERGVALLPLEKEAWRGAFRLADLARIYAMTGNQEKAIDLLERLLSIPSEFSATYIRLDPAWNPLHGSKRFEQLVLRK
ncbi:MAG TPA: protein kinase [Bacteroidota bacterium]